MKCWLPCSELGNTQSCVHKSFRALIQNKLNTTLLLTIQGEHHECTTVSSSVPSQNTQHQSDVIIYVSHFSKIMHF